MLVTAAGGIDDWLLANERGNCIMLVVMVQGSTRLVWLIP